MNKKLESSIFIVIGIVLITILGTTFAYFFVAPINSGNVINGQTADFDASISLSTIYRATNLVPLQNNLVTTAITKETDKCIDRNNRDVCSLYSITLSNNGGVVSLTPYITTTSSTYTTTNLKCQLYNSNFEAVSDIMTPSNTANASVYFTSNSSNLGIVLSSASQTYYLVIWLTDISASQPADYSKAYSGTITFASGTNGQVSVDFTT